MTIMQMNLQKTPPVTLVKEYAGDTLNANHNARQIEVAVNSQTHPEVIEGYIKARAAIDRMEKK
jgi:hypothetical protein